MAKTKRLYCVSAKAMATEPIVEFKKLIESEYQKTYFSTTAGKYALGNRRREPGAGKENGGAGENCEKGVHWKLKIVAMIISVGAAIVLRVV